MEIEQLLKSKLFEAAQQIGSQIAMENIVIEHSKDKKHGDFASNIALQLSKIIKKSPIDIAYQIIRLIDIEEVEKIEVAKPGFINFFLKSEILSSIIQKIISSDYHYGESDFGNNLKINVEFVSANPTGSLHLGHARGAALGDVIARLYDKVGFVVTREFYVNDAGVQIDKMADSIYIRYRQLFNYDDQLPEDGYHGEEIVEIAKTIKEEVGGHYLNDYEIDFFKKRGISFMLEMIKEDLKLFRVEFDEYQHESRIRDQSLINEVLVRLQNHIYKEDGATYLRTSSFSDDKDRVIIKSDDNYTYFLPDIVYHLDKINRGHQMLIDVLGADHHGYISRMKAALEMCGYPRTMLEIEIIQLVRLIKDKQEVKMSKRTGVGITMRELIEEVGVDAARYFFVARAGTTHLDFDINVALTKDNSNPVYYAQYAHARLSSILKAGKDIEIDDSGTLLNSEPEILLMKHLSQFPNEVLMAAKVREPYRITNYIYKLATYTHSFYTICRVIDRDNLPLTKSRLALAKASRIVMRNALDLIGVSSPENM
jgi:arginyl-tRNA synthetase